MSSSITNTQGSSAALQPQAATATNSSQAVSNANAAAKQFSTSDFMTLLVTEMKNQDPTQPTDPTQYITQLVSVNSLQQLIQINEGVNGTSASTKI